MPVEQFNADEALKRAAAMASINVGEHFPTRHSGDPHAVLMQYNRVS